MKVIEIVESKQWRNTVTGNTASIYGAVPYVSDKDRPNWIVEVRGYTWKLNNGTIGLGRMPVKTMAEAIQVMDKVNSL